MRWKYKHNYKEDTKMDNNLEVTTEVIEDVVEVASEVKFPWKKLGITGIVVAGLATAGVVAFKKFKEKKTDVAFEADEELVNDVNEEEDSDKVEN